jgi:hypothetical protein
LRAGNGQPELQEPVEAACHDGEPGVQVDVERGAADEGVEVESLM